MTITEVVMLRRKSLSLDKGPVDRMERRERRSSVAALHQHHLMQQQLKMERGDRRGSLSGTQQEVTGKERRGSIVHRWFRHISDAAEAYKHRDGRARREGAVREGTIPQSPTDTETSDESLEKTKDPEESSTGEVAEADTSATSQDTADSSQPSPIASGLDHGRKSVDSSPSQRRHVEPLRLTTVENNLIQPSEVIISQKPVLKAEPVLTPLEQLRLKDEEIRRALLEKQQLVAEILHVPKEEFETIAELAGEPGVDKEATELVLAAISQANQLVSVLNDSLRVTQEEAVTVTSEVLPGFSPRGGRRKTRMPGMPTEKVHTITTSLNTQLTQLLKIIKERDEERERLRREVQRNREQIHVLHENHRRSQSSGSGSAHVAFSDDHDKSEPVEHGEDMAATGGPACSITTAGALGEEVNTTQEVFNGTLSNEPSRVDTAEMNLPEREQPALIEGATTSEA